MKRIPPTPTGPRLVDAPEYKLAADKLVEMQLNESRLRSELNGAYAAMQETPTVSPLDSAALALIAGKPPEAHPNRHGTIERILQQLPAAHRAVEICQQQLDQVVGRLSSEHCAARAAEYHELQTKLDKQLVAVLDTLTADEAFHTSVTLTYGARWSAPLCRLSVHGLRDRVESFRCEAVGHGVIPKERG